jgi:hypothetical protein
MAEKTDGFDHNMLVRHGLHALDGRLLLLPARPRVQLALPQRCLLITTRKSNLTVW